MNKRMRKMLIIVGVIFGLIFGWKAFQTIMMKRYFANMKEPAATVSTMTVSNLAWKQQLKAVGTLRAIVGVDVTTELAGMVQKIYFSPGATVKDGTILVQLNADAEIGLLHALQAQSELAKITYNRDKAQFTAHAVSKQVLDQDEWNLKNLLGQVAQQAAIVDKKTIRAPFAGHLGISNVNPGQYLNVADKVTSLQTLDPIYVDFYLPQQAVAKLKIGQEVIVRTDAYPGKSYTGKVTTIEPAVDKTTRNIEVEATLVNTTLELTPGMFAGVEVSVGEPKNYLTLPHSAITFNPFGDIAYIVNSTKQEDNEKADLTVKQVFVITGDTRGDQVQILKGLKEGQTVVTSGQLKLRNGSHIVVNNEIQPSNNPDPKLVDG